MRWSDIRKAYPDQWLIIEALQAHTENNRRMLDNIAVTETCKDGASAMRSYRRLHRQYPSREFYFVHTNRQELQIKERRWAGIRSNYAAHPKGRSPVHHNYNNA